MAKKKKRMSNKQKRAEQIYRPEHEIGICPRCKKLEKHFVAPSLGEEGFYTCQAQDVVNTLDYKME